MDNPEIIKKAITIEVDNQFINVRGKHKTFSEFICGEIKKEIKKDKNNIKWQIMLDYFVVYPTASLYQRKQTINKFCRLLSEKPKTPDKDKQPHEKSLDTEVMYLKGVGPKLALAFGKLGIFKINDLLMYLPRKHVDYSSRTNIKDLTPGETTTIFGYIKSTEAYTSSKGLGIIKVKIADNTGQLTLHFFQGKANRYALERIKAQFPKDTGIMASGTVKINNFDLKPTLDNVTYSILADDIFKGGNVNLGRIVPLYTTSDKLNIKVLRRAISTALNDYKDLIQNVLPDFIIKKYDLLDKKTALEQIHFPENQNMLEKARFTLVFEELFLLQLKFALLRKQNKKNHSLALNVKKDGLVMKYIKSLPFELTKSQKDAINEILNDLSSDTPMQRLLQGDVGSGKTVVAAAMLLAAVENGYQAAIMAPTEILAQQHYNGLVDNLNNLGVRLGLFLGSNGIAQRRKIETDIRNGQIDIAIGTHALIQDNIEFKNLGAVVIDEQHRFGVAQRMKLAQKSTNPQILSMTATPIPRTMAISLNGDLDVTTIEELPKGRKPIITDIATSSKQIYSRIKAEIEKGHQAYIIYPLIEESETLSAKAATVEAEKLQKTVFPEYKIGLLHGKLPNKEKDLIMNKFKNGEFNILVSTTVVEVGVDVPNATLIVIENAERFGLSQLHQLRGRVGRCSLQSYCILKASTKSQDAKERLKIMTETNNGFIIAEKDLQLRGPGEFLGIRQSGLPDFVISDVLRDTQTLELARNEAVSFCENYDVQDFPSLNKSVEKAITSNHFLSC